MAESTIIILTSTSRGGSNCDSRFCNTLWSLEERKRETNFSKCKVTMIVINQASMNGGVKSYTLHNNSDNIS